MEKSNLDREDDSVRNKPIQGYYCTDHDHFNRAHIAEAINHTHQRNAHVISHLPIQRAEWDVVNDVTRWKTVERVATPF